MKNYNIKNEEKTLIVEESSVAYENNSYSNFVIQNNYSLVKKAKSGIATKVFYTFADSINLPEKVVASLLNLSPRTISNYRDAGKNLEAHHSEHLLKLIALFEKGKEYLGNIDEFNRWLKVPFWNTEEIPFDFLNTSGGVDLLSACLERMAQGYPA
ncbi:antitoxin Xre-like helix-turn-helix domain-containing protein [Frigoriflavimonas asaccharolytica]|uniref:Uncharacterized protein (DUF2384 family) n=1 Tax=Frigoriflavimonas asaccharolytica TaxID=2735899 RepID=A0A8J8GBU3_9FLAO|nr:antitoxin Xre-like helix-turn-helix domain-containing protein [Frigoriflavimonas asaccharolytica]NRS92827.1 uncharacterized protein (DUF2384 family) [Frigoriflavimonas asaccharolytica]